ncbi:MAG: alpha-isopropylmalate synthase regulatory domain-containing protein [Schaedlerella sp.]|nr:alpha-isopropylmalate synthase regulatory domain-containing protein [Schaedlerella sp.]
MDRIRISDITLKQTGKDFSLSFKEKIEIPKLLDKLDVSVIELEGIEQTKIDSLRIKSIASTVKNSIIAVPVALSQESVDLTWNALKEARHPRLQVVASVSTVQMEYIFHKKPDIMLQAIEETIRACAAKTVDVEFIAEDATRSDENFLYKAVKTAIEAGAKTITVCDATGLILPDEFGAFLDRLYKNVPVLKDVILGVSSSNDLAMADACAIEAIKHGVREIKASAYQCDCVSLPHIARLLASKGDAFDVTCSVRTTEIKRIIRQIAWMCETNRSKNSPFDNGVQEVVEDVVLSSHDNMSTVLKAVEKLGYDLSEEDGSKVWASFQNIAKRKEHISTKELDTIIASVAMQVPATYVLDTYSITSSNITSSMAHMKLTKHEQPIEGVALGDGPIDAAFLAIENILGCHYELDDFQVRSVTEGREAMGEAVVKLRNNGKLYSGRGTSTDIVGSSIHAYINAVNKIVYEEAEA